MKLQVFQAHLYRTLVLLVIIGFQSSFFNLKAINYSEVQGVAAAQESLMLLLDGLRYSQAAGEGLAGKINEPLSVSLTYSATTATLIAMGEMDHRPIHLTYASQLSGTPDLENMTWTGSWTGNWGDNVINSDSTMTYVLDPVEGYSAMQAAVEGTSIESGQRGFWRWIVRGLERVLQYVIVGAVSTKVSPIVGGLVEVPVKRVIDYTSELILDPQTPGDAPSKGRENALYPHWQNKGRRSKKTQEFSPPAPHVQFSPLVLNSTFIDGSGSGVLTSVPENNSSAMLLALSLCTVWMFGHNQSFSNAKTGVQSSTGN